MSRIDYCNSVLAGLPQSTIAPLQRVQNTTARLVFELGTREHVTASLLQLHWLPVRWRVQFKLCCLMHSIFHGRCPDYLSNIVRPVDLSRSRAGLRSSSTTNFVMPLLRTKCGESALFHAGPAAWNALPDDMHAVSDSMLFRKRLKTHFLVLLLTFVDYC